MLSILPSQRFTNHSEWMRMKPASQTSSMFASRNAASMAASNVFARGIVLVRDDFDRDARLARNRQSLRVFPIGNHQRDLGRIIRRARGIDQRGEIAAAAGNQNGGTNAAHSFIAPR